MIPVDLISDIFSPSGYSAHAREVVDALTSVPDIDLRIIDNKHDRMTIQVPEERKTFYNGLKDKQRKPKVRIQFETPEFFAPQPDCVNVGFTQWETTRIPDTDLNGDVRFNWVKQMNRMQCMWTSCEMAKSAFYDSGVCVPTHIVHGPVNTEFFTPGLPELSLQNIVFTKDGQFIPRENRPFVVAMMAQWTYRKNIEAFLYSTLSRFVEGEIVILLKTYGSTMNETEGLAVAARVREIIERIKSPSRPRLTLLTSMLTDDDIAKLFSSVDAYVNTSRGEGFCMPLAQAMASGCVPITSAFSAPADYVNTEFGYLVPYTKRPAIGQAGPWYRYDQSWGDIGIDDTAVAIRKAMGLKVSDPVAWENMRKAARARIQQMNTQAAGLRMAEIIRSLVT